LISMTDIFVWYPRVISLFDLIGENFLQNDHADMLVSVVHVIYLKSWDPRQENLTW
jgi:hypothetical protein